MMPLRDLCLTLTVVCSFCVGMTSAARPIPARIVKSLDLAGNNRAQIELALSRVPAAERTGMEFLVAYMPKRDLQQLTADFLLENVRYAYRAWNESSWKKDVSESLFLNNILPYASVTERRDRWREDFYKRCRPLVQDVKSPAHAAAILNQKIFPMLKVRYSRQRRRADQGPYESIETGTASCTGLSILLIDACRAVGVPARFAGTPLWSDRSGNHSWVEVWDQGWHFTGAAEPTGDQLDRGWFIGRASKALRDDRMHAIYAVSYRETPLLFPIVWTRNDQRIHAFNVTDRYTQNQKPRVPGSVEIRFRVVDPQSSSRQQCQLELFDVAGKLLFEGETKDERFDGNDHLTVVVPMAGTYQIKIHHGTRMAQMTIKVTEDGQLFTFDQLKWQED